MSTRSLTRIAYDRIRRAIVSGSLDLGEPLSENDLASALRMSKAPVRAALSELRLRGLVEVIPQSGTYIFSPTREEIEELCDFRFLLEAQALRAAVAHDADAVLVTLERVVRRMTLSPTAAVARGKLLDSAFHRVFIARCGNRYLKVAYDTIELRIDALRYRFMDTPEYRHRAFEEHQEILRHLRAGAIERAVRVLRAHISRTRQFQSRAAWARGRSRRRDYKFRDHEDLFQGAPKPRTGHRVHSRR